MRERECKVYVLFGKVQGTLSEPGLYFLWTKMGAAALIVNWLGTCYTLDMSLDQVKVNLFRARNAIKRSITQTPSACDRKA